MTHPLITIWYDPRATVSAIAGSRPHYLFFFLASVFGVHRNLSLVFRRGIGHMPDLPMSMVIVVNIGVGIVFGITYFWVFSYLLDRVSRLLGGVGTASKCRTVLAWASVPQIPTMLVLLLILMFAPAEWFYHSPSELVGGDDLSIQRLRFFAGLLGMATAVWSIIIAIVGHSEVQGFGNGKSVLSFVLAGVVIIVPTVAVFMGVATLAG